MVHPYPTSSGDRAFRSLNYFREADGRDGRLRVDFDRWRTSAKPSLLKSAISSGTTAVSLTTSAHTAARGYNAAVQSAAAPAMPGGGPPTFPQYFLNSRYAHVVLGSEVLYYLSCSEFRVPLPYRAYPDSCSSPPIKLPPCLLLRLTMLGSDQPTLSQCSPNPSITGALGPEARHYLPRGEFRMLLEYFTYAES
jgi:hypothetical protein